jgi:hypothetical protein
MLQGATLSGILLGSDLGKGNTVEQGSEKGIVWWY